MFTLPQSEIEAPVMPVQNTNVIQLRDQLVNKVVNRVITAFNTHISSIPQFDDKYTIEVDVSDLLEETIVKSVWAMVRDLIVLRFLNSGWKFNNGEMHTNPAKVILTMGLDVSSV